MDYAVNSGGVGMWPRTDGILLVGTFERNEWSLDVNVEEEHRILDGTCRLFAGMRT